MKYPFSIYVINVFISSLLNGQNTPDLDSYGFIDIKTDSMDVALFIDGIFVGTHPLKEPIPVISGFHEVGYIPPEIQNKKVREDLSDGLKRVYVAPGDTLEVFLFYDHYLTQVEILQQEKRIQNYIGFSLFGVLLYVLLMIF